MKKIPDSDCFTGKFYPTFKEEIKPIQYKHLQKIDKEIPLNEFYKANTTLIPKKITIFQENKSTA